MTRSGRFPSSEEHGPGPEVLFDFRAREVPPSLRQG
jgi:hypothetical protein